MLPHLHVHLEPEQRRWRAVGLTPRDPTDPAAAPSPRERFFAGHALAAVARAPITLADLRRFVADVHAEQRAQGADYVELRLSPLRFTLDGTAVHDVLWTAHDAVASATSPVISLILLVNRASSDAFIDEVLGLVQRGLPATIVGLDLAGDELAHPQVGRFRRLFTSASAHQLGVSVHAGEFGDDVHVWRAIDELGANRLGHAIAAGLSRRLIRRLAEDRILVEASLSTNLTLGAVPSLGVHPVRAFLDAGVPVCFNTDVPVYTGWSLPDELALAARVLGVADSHVAAIQAAAWRYRFAPASRS